MNEKRQLLPLWLALTPFGAGLLLLEAFVVSAVWVADKLIIYGARYSARALRWSRHRRYHADLIRQVH